MIERKASVTRSTEKSEVKVVLNLNGRGISDVQTGFPFLDRMLVLFAKNGGFDLQIRCAPGDADFRYISEETALCLGLALERALGDRDGIVRIGYSLAPVEEYLARGVVEFSGHPCLVYRVAASASIPGVADSGAMESFWRAFVSQVRITLHLELLYGGDGLPAFEAVFKAAARALSNAVAIQSR